MKTNILTISNDVLFYNLFEPLIIRELKDVQTSHCTNFTEIDEKVKDHKFDLILVDGGTFGISSIEIIHYLRMEKKIVAPIWFFPEIVSNDYIYKSKQMGVSRIINKPFDPFKIIDEIKLEFKINNGL